MNAKTNQVQFQNDGISIEVDNSASPLIYPFKKSIKAKKLFVKAEFIGGLPKMQDNITQGMGKYDDFILRMGLIYQGDDRLNWLQRQFAPTWLVEMEKLLPDSMGIKEVRFYTTCLQERVLNKPRRHMLHSKLIEECVTLVKQPGDFSLVKELNTETPVIGLWIASDADEMGHKFRLKIKEIKIEY